MFWFTVLIILWLCSLFIYDLRDDDLCRSSHCLSAIFIIQQSVELRGSFYCVFYENTILLLLYFRSNLAFWLPFMKKMDRIIVYLQYKGGAIWRVKKQSHISISKAPGALFRENTVSKMISRSTKVFPGISRKNMVRNQSIFIIF